MWNLAFFFAELFWVKENERMKKRQIRGICHEKLL